VLLILAMTVTPILASITDDIDPKRTITISINAEVLLPTVGVATVTAIVDGDTVKVEGTYTISGNELTVEVTLDGKDVEIVDVSVAQ
jgi:hypothetical protein